MTQSMLGKERRMHPDLDRIAFIHTMLLVFVLKETYCLE